MEKNYKKIYLSMPITGYDIHERIDYSEKKKMELENDYNCEVVTPFSFIDYDPNRTYEECMNGCIKELMTCTDVYFSNGWTNSRGCLVEYIVAKNCGLNVINVE